MFTFKKSNSRVKRALSLIISFTFFFNIVLSDMGLAQALNLPAPGTMLTLTSAFAPPIIKGLEINPLDPFQFDFFVNSGEDNLEPDVLKIEAERMIRYFLASLTIPEDDLWVNLSPYEQDRIIEQTLSQTDLGRDLLAEDYLLKQIMASVLYPEDELGQAFWQNVYHKAYEKYGTTEIPIDTFHKVWILPDKAVVYETGNRAFVAEASLKVMLEQDYLALEQNQIPLAKANNNEPMSQELYSQILRDIVIPEITREVNEGKHFAQLRQIYNSLILANWYKDALRESILGKLYVNQKKVDGITLSQSAQEQGHVQKIYNQYLEAFKTGVYNYIRVEYDTSSQRNIPRKYFSGGADFAMGVSNLERVHVLEPTGYVKLRGPEKSNMVRFKAVVVDSAGLDPSKGKDQAMVVFPFMNAELDPQQVINIIVDTLKQSAEGIQATATLSSSFGSSSLRTGPLDEMSKDEKPFIGELTITLKDGSTITATKKTSFAYHWAITKFMDRQGNSIEFENITQDERSKSSDSDQQSSVVISLFPDETNIDLDDLGFKKLINVLQQEVGFDVNEVSVQIATHGREAPLIRALKDVNKIEKSQIEKIIFLFKDRSTLSMGREFAQPGWHPQAFIDSENKPILFETPSSQKDFAMKSDLKVQQKPDFRDRLVENQALVVSDELSLMNENDFRQVFYFDSNEGKMKDVLIKKHRIQELLDRDKIGILESTESPGQYFLAMKENGAVITATGDLLISTRTSYPTTAQEVPHGSRTFHYYTKFMPNAHMFFKFYGKDGEFSWISDVLKDSKVLVVAPGSLGEQLYVVDHYGKTIKIDAGFLGNLDPNELIKGELSSFAQQRVFYGLLAEAALIIRDGNDATPDQRRELVDRIAQTSKLTGHNRLEDAVFIYNLKNDVHRREKRKLERSEIKRFLCDRFERLDLLNGRLAQQCLMEKFGYAGEVAKGELTDLLDEIYEENRQIMVSEKPSEEKLRNPHADHDNLYFAHLQYLADHTLVDDRHVAQIGAMTARDSGLFGNKVVIYSELQFAPGWVAEVGFATSAHDFRSSLVDINEGLDHHLQEIEDTLFSSIAKDPKNRSFYIEEASKAYKDALSFERVKKGELQIGREMFEDIKKNLGVIAEIKNLPLLLLIMALRSSAVGEDDPRRAFPGQGSSALFVWVIEQLLGKLGFDVAPLTEIRDLIEELEKLDRSRTDQHEIFNQKQKELESKFNNVFNDLAKLLSIELLEGLAIQDPQSVHPWYELLDRVMGSLKERIDDGTIHFSEQEMDDLLFDVFAKAWLYVQASLFNIQAINYRLENKMSIYTKKYDDKGKVVPADLVKMSVLFLPMIFNREGWLTIGVNQSTGANQYVSTFNYGLTNSLVSGQATAETIASSPDGTMRRQVIPEGGSVFWEVPNPILQGTIKISFPENLKGFSMFPDEQKISDLTNAQVMLQEFFEAPIDSEGGFLFKVDGQGEMTQRRNDQGEFEYDRLGNPVHESSVVTFQLRSETVARWNNPFLIFQNFFRLRSEDAEKLKKQGLTIANGIAATLGGAYGEIAWIGPDTKPGDLDGKIAVALDTDPTMEHLLHQKEDEHGRVIEGPVALITAIGGKSTHGYLFCIEQGIAYIGGVGIPVVQNDLYPGRSVIVDCMSENGLVFDAEGLEEKVDFHIERAGVDIDVRLLPRLAELKDFKFGLNLDSGNTAQLAGAIKYWPGAYALGLKRNEKLLGALGGVAEGFLRYSNYLLENLIASFDSGKTLSKQEIWKLERILERELRYVSERWIDRMNYINHGKKLSVRVDLTQREKISATVDGDTREYSSLRAFFDERIKDQRIARTNDPKANESYDPKKEKDQEEIEYFQEMTKDYLDGKDYFERMLLPWFLEVYEEMKTNPFFVRRNAERINNQSFRQDILARIDRYISHNARYPIVVAKDIETIAKAYRGRASKQDLEVAAEVVSLLSMKTYERLDDRSSDKVWGVPGTKVISKGRNPYMDYRGLFLFIDNPVVLEWLLDIFSDVVQDGRFPIGIFTPITNDAQRFNEFRHRMFINGLIPAFVEQGAMAETPGWGSNPRIFLSTLLDFLSIGSNDYLMFLFALSRGLERGGKEHYRGFSPRHPSFIRAIATFVNEMKLFNEFIREPLGLSPVTCGFCGNWPGADELAAAFLQRLGLKAASVTVPAFKKAVETAALVINNPEKLTPEQREVFKKLLENVNFNLYDHIDEEANPATVEDWVTVSMSKFHQDILPFHYQFLLELDHSRYRLQEAETIQNLSLKLRSEREQLESLEQAIDRFSSQHRETNDLEISRQEAGKIHNIFNDQEIILKDKFPDIMKQVSSRKRELTFLVKELNNKLEIAQQKEKAFKYLQDHGYAVLEDSGKRVSDEKLGALGRELYEDLLLSYAKEQIENSPLKDGIIVFETAYEAPDLLRLNADGSEKGMWRFYEEEVFDPELDDRGLRKLVFRKDPQGEELTQAIKAGFNAYQRLRESLQGREITFSFAFVRDADEIERAFDLIIPEEKDREEFLSENRFGLSVMIPANIAIYDKFFGSESPLKDIVLSQEGLKVLAQFTLAADWDSPNRPIMNQPLIDLNRAAYYTENEMKLLRTAAARMDGRLLFSPLVSSEDLKAYKESLGIVDVPISLPKTIGDKISVFDDLYEKAQNFQKRLIEKISLAPDRYGDKEEYFNSMEFLMFQTGLIKFVYEAKLLLKQIKDSGQEQLNVVNADSLDKILNSILESLKSVVHLTHILPSESFSTVEAKGHWFDLSNVKGIIGDQERAEIERIMPLTAQQMIELSNHIAGLLDDEVMTLAVRPYRGTLFHDWINSASHRRLEPGNGLYIGLKENPGIYVWFLELWHNKDKRGRMLKVEIDEELNQRFKEKIEKIDWEHEISTFLLTHRDKDYAIVAQDGQRLDSVHGGIDFVRDQFNVQIRRDVNGMPLAVEFQDLESININGLMPVIINYNIISNLPLLLGYSIQQQDSDGQSVEMIVDDKRQMSFLN